MKFILTFLLKIIILFLLATIAYQIAYQNYIQFFIQNLSVTKEHLFVVNESALKGVLSDLLKLQWQQFTLINVLSSVYFNKFFYIVLFILILIIYYETKLRNLEYPNIQNQTSTSPQKSEHSRKAHTQSEVKKLVESKEYQEYLRRKEEQKGRQYNNEQDNGVVKQMQQKENQICG